MLVGVEGGKLRGEVTVESDRLWTVSCKVEFGIQLLLHTRHAEQAHRDRPFSGIGSFRHFRKRQCHVQRRTVCTVVHIERRGNPRKVTFNTLYPVRGVASRLNEKRQLAYLLLHRNRKGVVGVRFYRSFRHARKQPVRHLLHEGTRSGYVARSPGDGCHAAAHDDV